jgi:hypothetical protein
MAAPVSGPFFKALQLPGPGAEGGYYPPWLYRRQIWYTQIKPYDLPLPYRLELYVVERGTETFKAARDYSFCPAIDTTAIDDARNKTYKKLVDQLGDTSTWANNVIERGRTIETIAARATQLAKFVRSLLKLRFREAAKVLKMAAVPPKVSKKKSMANNFLEYHLGWEPLVKDIYNAADAYLDVPLFHVLTAKSTQSRYILQGVVPPYDRTDLIVRSMCHMGVRVRLKDFDSFLQARLGLRNPASVAWEAVPFSFVADWFVNVGQCIASVTDFSGLEVLSSFVTDYQVIKKRQAGAYYDSGLRPMTYWYQTVYLERGNGLPAPTPSVAPWKGFSPIRAATALSLLTQLMKDHQLGDFLQQGGRSTHPDLRKFSFR